MQADNFRRLFRVVEVATHFRATIDETYGDRLERVVLFGSRARGRSQPDFDEPC
jgi:predicted nucleotidyltransferase